MPGFLSPGKGVLLLLIPEYSGINKGQRFPDRSKTAHRKPPVKCFLTLTQVAHIAGRFFTNWVMREAHFHSKWLKLGESCLLHHSLSYLIGTLRVSRKCSNKLSWSKMKNSEVIDGTIDGSTASLTGLHYSTWDSRNSFTVRKMGQYYWNWKWEEEGIRDKKKTSKNNIRQNTTQLWDDCGSRCWTGRLDLPEIIITQGKNFVLLLLTNVYDYASED